MDMRVDSDLAVWLLRQRERGLGIHAIYRMRLALGLTGGATQTMARLFREHPRGHECDACAEARRTVVQHRDKTSLFHGPELGVCTLHARRDCPNRVCRAKHYEREAIR